jgi:aminoglycoside 6-adenylyltransferase
MSSTASVGRPEWDFEGKLVAWAERNDLVRAVLLTSTRAEASPLADVLSDYDVELYVADMDPFRDWEAWLPELGTVLLGNTPEERERRGMPEYVRGVFFDDMTKVDFVVAPTAVLGLIRGEPRLPPRLDVGYRVLLDKDGLTGGLPAPTHTAFIPARPTAREYRQLVEEFWFTATYVAKYLWRGETFGARGILDAEIRLHTLQPLLTWAIEVEHGWSVNTGFFGRWIRRYLKPELWAEVERAFGGSDDEGHWRALFQTIAVFRQCAESVAASLGYAYPHDLDERMTSYLLQIKDLPRQDQATT